MSKICNFEEWITSKNPYSNCLNSREFQKTNIHQDSLKFTPSSFDIKMYQEIPGHLNTVIEKLLKINNQSKILIHFVLGTSTLILKGADLILNTCDDNNLVFNNIINITNKFNKLLFDKHIFIYIDPRFNHAIMFPIKAITENNDKINKINLNKFLELKSINNYIIINPINKEEIIFKDPLVLAISCNFPLNYNDSESKKFLDYIVNLTNKHPNISVNITNRICDTCLPGLYYINTHPDLKRPNYNYEVCPEQNMTKCGIASAYMKNKDAILCGNTVDGIDLDMNEFVETRIPITKQTGYVHKSFLQKSTNTFIETDNKYKNKYLKYKNKYLQLKKLI